MNRLNEMARCRGYLEAIEGKPSYARQFHPDQYGSYDAGYLDGLRAKAAPELLEVLEVARKEMEELRDDETCDHEVGICWCGYFDNLRIVDAAIAKAKGEAGPVCPFKLGDTVVHLDNGRHITISVIDTQSRMLADKQRHGAPWHRCQIYETLDERLAREARELSGLGDIPRGMIP